MKEQTLKEFSIAIIDEFENLLDKYDIDIPSDDRTGDDSEAHIYGTEYGDLETSITNILNKLLEENNKEIVATTKPEPFISTCPYCGGKIVEK